MKARTLCDIIKIVETVMHRLVADLVTKKDLVATEHKVMSAITDWAASEDADLTAISTTLDAIVAGVKALDDKITALQNAAGPLGPGDQAALDGIQASSKALLAKVQGIDTTPPPATP